MLKNPSPTFTEILAVTQSSTVSAKQIGKIVSKDPSLAKTVLRVANSRQHGIGREVLDADRATLLLGATSIGHVALIHELVSCAAKVELKDREKLAFWEDCLRRASAANILAHRFGTVHPDMAFAIGFSLELGRIELLVEGFHSTQNFGPVRTLTGTERVEAEIQHFGRTHFQAFLEKTEEWGLPEVLLNALEQHHLDPQSIRDEASRPLTTFIARWSDIAAEVFSAKNPISAFAIAQTLLQDETGMSEPEVAHFFDQIALQTIAYSSVLSLPIDPQPTLQKLLSEAKGKKNPDSMSKDQLVGLVGTLLVRQDELEDELQELRANVLSMTQFDTLTGLPSRGHFMVNLRQEVARARRYDRPLALVILDMDEFTELNAKNGQEAGDESLRTASRTLERIMRDCDFLARSGGDEFVFLLPETDGIGGRIFAERVRACMEGLKVDLDNKRLRVSACVCGISLEDLTGEQDDHEVLYAVALRAVKKLRERGPNRVSWVETQQ
jgi:diguanylate cyclase (GGDEF)-like protein